MNAFFEHMIYRQKFRFFVHEDTVFFDKSQEVMAWLTDAEWPHVIRQSISPIGLGHAMEAMLPLIESKYMFYLQEDWEFERYVDVDQVVWMMDQHPEINSILFFKYRTPGVINGFPLEETSFEGKYCCLYNTWSLLPSVWRTEFVQKRWKTRKERPEGFFTNSLGSAQQRASPKFCREHLGVYIWGPQGNYRMVRHLGNTWRMASWRLEDGEPGGNEPGPEFDLKTRGPWLGPLPPRPSRKIEGGVYPISEEPEEVKEQFE
jgi:hypothetical protein